MSVVEYLRYVVPAEQTAEFEAAYARAGGHGPLRPADPVDLSRWVLSPPQTRGSGTARRR